MNTNLTFKTLSPLNVKGVKYVGEFSEPRSKLKPAQAMLQRCISGIARIEDFTLSTQLAIKREFYKLPIDEQEKHPDLAEFFAARKTEFDELVRRNNNKTEERRRKKPTADFSFLYS